MKGKQGNAITKVAVKMAISEREEEKALIEKFDKDGYKCVAVNVGGKMPIITSKIIENALVAAIRNNIIKEEYIYIGALAGAVREALNQIEGNMNGLSVGGKIGVARKEGNLSVALYFSIGLLHLNETAMAVSHRVIPID